MNTTPAARAGYLKLARLQIAVTHTYRWQVIAFLLSSLLQIFLLKVVWTAVYDGRSSVDGVPLVELISFLTIAQLQLLAMQPMMVWYLERRIHEGHIGLDLVRPLPFLGQLLAQQAGATIGYLPFLLVAIPFAFVLGNLAPPASSTAAVFYIASALLGYAVAMLIGLLMGLVAFWTVQTLGVAVIYRFAAQFFGGALIPLFLMPDGLRVVAELLPFQAQAHIPLSIYTGRTSEPGAIAAAIGLQLSWVLALALLAGLIWRRARRIVTVYGG
ncbi:MAG TPA: ABC-2 family transporter protein [Candidatus Limnocylindria bacterium]